MEHSILIRGVFFTEVRTGVREAEGASGFAVFPSQDVSVRAKGSVRVSCSFMQQRGQEGSGRNEQEVGRHNLVRPRSVGSDAKQTLQ